MILVRTNHPYLRMRCYTTLVSCTTTWSSWRPRTAGPGRWHGSEATIQLIQPPYWSGGVDGWSEMSRWWCCPLPHPCAPLRTLDLLMQYVCMSHVGGGIATVQKGNLGSVCFSFSSLFLLVFDRSKSWMIQKVRS
jgi:hypothetical protein